MDLYRAALGLLRMFALAAGSGVIFIGIAQAARAARGPGGRARAAREILDHAALGLDFFVGATLLNLVLNPTPTVAATIAITIVTRKLITFSLGRSARDSPA